MSKRQSRPLFIHEGFLLRQQKSLADGTELLYCDKRQTLGCTASARRVNGHIFMRTGHILHEADEGFANTKLAKHALKQIAANTTCSPKKLIDELQSSLGPISLGASRLALTRMIHRARQTTAEPNATVKLEQKPELLEDHADVSDDLPDANIGELLQNIIKQEEPEEETEMTQSSSSNINHSHQTITIPVGSFFETLQDIVRYNVQESNQSVVEQITNVVNEPKRHSSEQAKKISSNDVNNCIKDFLVNMQNFASGGISDGLKLRTEAVINKINSNVVML
ncbi:hypothetical protein L5515_004710 [Caenorhabditis briggsae]|uniref:Uncharacterized protein n=1 Tax=Caenorhabditis briggsae TaxID=6238 RepID=A0AAE9EL95_CAEBR|nr:hypothetical protein L5515_004710 [Caenorhabditis briggsae]